MDYMNRKQEGHYNVNPVSVSYTHLDVYKRQIINRMGCFGVWALQGKWKMIYAGCLGICDYMRQKSGKWSGVQ